jgi:hypothetical protein
MTDSHSWVPYSRNVSRISIDVSCVVPRMNVGKVRRYVHSVDDILAALDPERVDCTNKPSERNLW